MLEAASPKVAKAYRRLPACLGERASSLLNSFETFGDAMRECWKGWQLIRIFSLNIADGWDCFSKALKPVSKKGECCILRKMLCNALFVDSVYGKCFLSNNFLR